MHSRTISACAGNTGSPCEDKTCFRWKNLHLDPGPKSWETGVCKLPKISNSEVLRSQGKLEKKQCRKEPSEWISVCSPDEKDKCHQVPMCSQNWSEKSPCWTESCSSFISFGQTWKKENTIFQQEFTTYHRQLIFIHPAGQFAHSETGVSPFCMEVLKQISTTFQGKQTFFQRKGEKRLSQKDQKVNGRISWLNGNFSILVFGWRFLHSFLFNCEFSVFTRSMETFPFWMENSIF